MTDLTWDVGVVRDSTTQTYGEDQMLDIELALGTISTLDSDVPLQVLVLFSVSDCGRRPDVELQSLWVKLEPIGQLIDLIQFLGYAYIKRRLTFCAGVYTGHDAGKLA